MALRRKISALSAMISESSPVGAGEAAAAGSTARTGAPANRRRAARRVLWPSADKAPLSAEMESFDIEITSLRHAECVIQKVTYLMLLKVTRGKMIEEQWRAARAMIGWSQGDLANQIDVSVLTIKRLESGGQNVSD